MAVIERDVVGEVCRVRLNRPEKLNALNEEVRIALTETFTELADRPDVKVVVLEGEGRAFSAGADLTGQGAALPDSWAGQRHWFGGWNRVLDLMDALPQVTVGKLHSHVVGGGCVLAINCDVRIAADDVTIRIPELAIGVPLTWASVPRLSREIGLPLARDLVLTGRPMLGEEAKACGFVQRLVARDQLDAATDELVGQLIAMPAGPLALSKAMFGAIGRERAGATGWADADLLRWSGREAESQHAALGYVNAQLGGSSNGSKREAGQTTP